MGEVAKFKLITSKGVVLAGDPVPDGLLSEKELGAIREAGGLEGAPAKKGKGKSGKGGSGADAAAIAAAEQKVLDAQAAVTAAGTDTVVLDKAKEDLAEAEAELIALKG